MVYQPVFTAVEAKVCAVAKERKWRVAHLMQEDDVVQEGRLQFLRMCKRNQRNGVVYESERHFVNAFMVAFTRHLITLAHRDTRYANSVTLTCELDDIEPFVAGVSGDDDRMMLLEIDLLCAPNRDIRDVLNLLFNSPPRVQRVLSRAFDAGGKAGNNMVCAMLGYDPQQRDLLGEVRQFLIDRGE